MREKLLTLERTDANIISPPKEKARRTKDKKMKLLDANSIRAGVLIYRIIETHCDNSIISDGTQGKQYLLENLVASIIH